jgi:hypothetical protein
MRANGEDGVIATPQLKVNSILLVHAGTIEGLPVLLDNFDAEGGVSQISTDQPKCFDEFGL